MPPTVPAGWTQEANALTRNFPRADFMEALAFIVEIGRIAEAIGHHPEITLHHYRQVDLRLSTHSAGHQVTAHDFDLAERINDLDDGVVRQRKIELQRDFNS